MSGPTYCQSYNDPRCPIRVRVRRQVARKKEDCRILSGVRARNLRGPRPPTRLCPSAPPCPQAPAPARPLLRVGIDKFMWSTLGALRRSFRRLSVIQPYSCTHRGGGPTSESKAFLVRPDVRFFVLYHPQRVAAMTRCFILAPVSFSHPQLTRCTAPLTTAQLRRSTSSRATVYLCALVLAPGSLVFCVIEYVDDATASGTRSSPWMRRRCNFATASHRARAAQRCKSDSCGWGRAVRL